MPVVDLSRIGLEGIEHAHRVFESQARVQESNQRVQSAQITDAEKMFELSQLQRNQELADIAAGKIADVARGGSGNIDPDGTSPDDDMDSLAEPLEILSRTFMQGGAPVAGTEYAKAASEIRKRESDMRKAEFENQGQQLDNMEKAAELVSAYVGTAQTPQEWDAGWQAVEESGLVPDNLIDMFKSQGFSHDMVALVNEQALAAKERAELSRQALNTQRQIADSENLRNYRDEMLRISRGRLAEQKKTRERLERQGKSASVPSDNAVDSVRSVLISEVFGGKSPGKDHPGLEAGAYGIASRANQLVRENQALDWDTAVHRAVSESQAAGDWEPWVNIQKIAGIPYDSDPAPPRYKPSGKTKKAAMELPKFNGKIDTSKLVVGRYYMIDGEAKKFTGE